MMDSIPDDGPSVPASEHDAGADAPGAADDALTTMQDETPIAEDSVGAGTSTVDAPDVDMATVTDTTPTASAGGCRILPRQHPA